jgi:hypothetical protein
MQDRIHLISVVWNSNRRFPRRFEALVITMTALGARPMAGGERCRLVEEEKLGIRMRPQHLTPTPAKRCATGDPAPHLPGAHKVSSVIVQYASIAHQRATLWYSHDLAKGRHPILQRHKHLLNAMK